MHVEIPLKERARALRFLAKWSRFVREIRGKCTFAGTGASERVSDGMSECVSEYKGGRVGLRVEMRELGSVTGHGIHNIAGRGKSLLIYSHTASQVNSCERDENLLCVCARVCESAEASHK